MKLRVKVTQEHVDRARRIEEDEPGVFISQTCPVALALLDVLPKDSFVSVSSHEIDVDVPKVKYHLKPTPPNAYRVIHWYDLPGDSEPITFPVHFTITLKEVGA